MVLPTLNLEESLWSTGFKYICGIDEVGRGSWAGPLIVAGVILPQDFVLPEGLADSKLVKPSKRKSLSITIKQQAAGFYISQISPKIIDKIGLAKAAQMAFRQVAGRIRPSPHYVLIDAFYIRHFNRRKQQAVKDGDKVCASIAAASIIAKVHRDELMKKQHFRYPKYGFAKHKGYGTSQHQRAIRAYGFSKIHRRSFNLNYLIA